MLYAIITVIFLLAAIETTLLISTKKAPKPKKKEVKRCNLLEPLDSRKWLARRLYSPEEFATGLAEELNTTDIKVRPPCHFSAFPALEYKNNRIRLYGVASKINYYEFKRIIQDLKYSSGEGGKPLDVSEKIKHFKAYRDHYKRIYKN